jgi:hypothetical protein
MACRLGLESKWARYTGFATPPQSDTEIFNRERERSADGWHRQ